MEDQTRKKEAERMEGKEEVFSFYTTGLKTECTDLKTKFAVTKIAVDPQNGGGMMLAAKAWLDFYWRQIRGK